MRLFLIANPIAGHGKTRRLIHSFISELRSSGATVAFRWTEYPGHARELAKEGAGFDAIVAVGGDGTVHEVAAGIIVAGISVPLGVAPFGSGNDFARVVRMHGPAEAIARSLLENRVHRIDYGIIDWTALDGTSATDTFVNAAGCGFDALVAREVINTRRWRGHLRYLATVLRCLRLWTNPVVTVEWWPSTDEGETSWRGRLLLCTAGNGTSSGGGFLLTPRARSDDGQLDVCKAEAMPLVRILQVLPLALRGSHLRAPEVSSFRTFGIRLHCAEGIPVHLDGEVIPHLVSQLSIRTVESGISVLVSN
ncbi:MAG: diacylglycerol/lipid kinase family protein [Rhodothermales bacterium]